MIQGNRGLITAEFMLTEAEGMDMGWTWAGSITTMWS